MDSDNENPDHRKIQKPLCLWLTGMPAAGKSTIAISLEQRILDLGKRTFTLDGDNIRQGLNRDLGFSQSDRIENIRRVAEVARLFVDAGLTVITAFISPYRREREFARSLFAPGQFFEIFVDTPLDECERRDPKGLYAKARQGELMNFTGIDGPYEPPLSPEIRLQTVAFSVDDCVEQIIRAIEQ